MKRGEELQIKPIRCENKQGNDCLKQYVYSLNDILFPLSKRYISSGARNRLMTKLTHICKELSTTEVPPNCLPKKNEILDKCRTMYKALRNYESDDNEYQRQSVVKYQLSQYLKNKPQDDEEILKTLNSNKEIAEDYGTTPAFIKMQEELLQNIEHKYKI